MTRRKRKYALPPKAVIIKAFILQAIDDGYDPTTTELDFLATCRLAESGETVNWGVLSEPKGKRADDFSDMPFANPAKVRARALRMMKERQKEEEALFRHLHKKDPSGKSEKALQSLLGRLSPLSPGSIEDMEMAAGGLMTIEWAFGSKGPFSGSGRRKKERERKKDHRRGQED